ncbi:MAG: imidazoleglycerol-phosphate dehydratase HisB [Halobacteriota archaeon]|nr:imidazoleglycerol-phosphate dehydratase HisB [Halobacteriota archaeon]
MRRSKSNRRTKETEIDIRFDLDGSGEINVDTGIPFFDHILGSFATHGIFDLTLKASGDLEVDSHHTVEDVGICLGEALDKSLGDKKKIRRFGSASIPMDDSIAICAMDIGGRGYLVFDAEFTSDKVGGMSTQLVEHFLHSFAYKAGINLNIKAEGKDDHHIVEAIFKALGVSLDGATQIDERRKSIPSTKGSL